MFTILKQSLLNPIRTISFLVYQKGKGVKNLCFKHQNVASIQFKTRNQHFIIKEAAWSQKYQIKWLHLLVLRVDQTNLKRLKWKNKLLSWIEKVWFVRMIYLSDWSILEISYWFLLNPIQSRRINDTKFQNFTVKWIRPVSNSFKSESTVFKGREEQRKCSWDRRNHRQMESNEW